VLSEADVDYIRAGFVALDELCRARGDDPQAVRAEIAAGRLPGPSYLLDDGTQMVPPDYFDLVDEAGGVAHLSDAFLRRYAEASAAEPEALPPAQDEWQAYLSGEYGVCLRRVSPETIVRKSALMQRIEGLLEDAQRDSPDWRASLRTAVDELDALEREFAPYDRIRFGGPVSRDRLIAAVRERYPAVFEHAVAGS
jgi:hypothetical protein